MNISLLSQGLVSMIVNLHNASDWFKQIFLAARLIRSSGRSSVWNFCARYSDVITKGKQRWLRKKKKSVVLSSKKNQTFTLTRMGSREMQTIVSTQNFTPTKASCQAVNFWKFVCLAMEEKFIQEMFKCLNALETQEKFIENPKRVHDVCLMCQINI